MFSDKCLYAADVLTQDEKDGKSLSERFAAHNGEKEYFIKEKTSQDTFNILKEAIERAGLKVNVVDKNKILDMLLSSPRFMGRLQEERDDAVSDNPSFKRLNSNGKVHLSHNPLTHQNSSAKILKETEITKKAIRGHHTYVSSKRYSLTR